MKKLLAVSCLSLFILCAPAASAYTAHGGFEKITDHAFIYVNQAPVSPLTGEEVHVNMVFKDRKFESLQNLPVHLTLVRSEYGDASKDETLESKDFVTDENGSLDYHYAFPDEGYYDVVLSFAVAGASTSTEDATDFIIQARSAATSTVVSGSALPLAAYVIGVALIALSIFSMAAARYRKRGAAPAEPSVDK
ncbi:MAG TPA: hypothetical protein VHF05_01415 [Candidatus Paceibacterota bacterium]|jgi:hypothetical protein|nr:hypothetical protein [Candidatus Paceibacterota bacterium]